MNNIAVVLFVLTLLFCVTGCNVQEKAVTAAIESVSAREPASEAASAEASPSVPEEPAVPEEPDTDWLFDTPENHGVDGTLLNQFHDAIREIEIRSVVIVKDGTIISEYYKEGYDEDYGLLYEKLLGRTDRPGH